MTAVLFAVGLVLLIGGADLLVRGATRIAAAAGIAPLVIGLTVVAFGTSAPELAVTTAATVQGNADLALGNVVGSNILNVLLILGLSAVVAPLVVQRRVVRAEVPLMIAITALVGLLTVDGSVSRLEGAALLVGGITYTVVLVLQARKANARTPSASPTRRTPLALAGSAVLVVVGLGLLILGSHWIVEGAQAMAAALGVPNLVIGLTVVSIGTSLPELATSVVATARGERDLAVGNIIGSNVFNLLIILGAAALVSDAGLPVPLSALTFDIPVMLVVAIVCLPIFLTGLRIDRLEGLIFLVFYGVYTTYLVLRASQHEALSELREAVLVIGIPLTLPRLRRLRAPRTPTLDRAGSFPPKVTPARLSPYALLKEIQPRR